MTIRKQRLTVTVDEQLLRAGRVAVEAGDADSVSGWVSDALEEKIRRDHKLSLLAAVIEDFEREFGEITSDEIASQQREDRAGATVVRGKRRSA